MRVVVDLDQRMLKDVQQKLGAFSNRAPNAISNAINRAVTNVNSNIKKEVRKEYIVRAGDIQATLKVERASRASLSGKVKSTGNPISLEKFKISPKTPNPKRKAPIKAAVKKGSLKTVLGAFVADINGAKVFERKSSERLPIKKLFGPSVPQMINNEGIRMQIEQEGHQTFNNRLGHEINRILGSGTA